MKIKPSLDRGQVTGDRLQGTSWHRYLSLWLFLVGIPAHHGFAQADPSGVTAPSVETAQSETTTAEEVIPDGYLAPLVYDEGQAIFGYETFAGSGNEWKFKQYHTPQSLPVLRVL